MELDFKFSKKLSGMLKMPYIRVSLYAAVIVTDVSLLFSKFTSCNCSLKLSPNDKVPLNELSFSILWKGKERCNRISLLYFIVRLYFFHIADLHLL